MKKRFFLFSLLILSIAFLAIIYIKTAQVLLAQDVTAWTLDQRGDCGVVLTGGPGRVREGFDLLAQGRIKKLIISGVYPQAELRDIFPQWPFYGPLSPDDIILEKRSGTTYGNAQQSLPYLEALRCKDVVLITSRIHMYRSFKIFRSVLPLEIAIQPRAIISGSYQTPWHEIFVESTKTIFYKIWAF